MFNIKLFCVSILVLLISRTINAQYTFQDAFPNLPDFDFPVDLRNSGDCTNRIFVVEKEGIIKVFENKSDVEETKIFLDITDRVFIEDIEMGLLGLTFHPNYDVNGYFYVNYTAANPRRTIVSRFKVSETNPDSADKNSEYEIINYLQPLHNHNGGWMEFGPYDGYLYISSGDGGSYTNAQRKDVLLGKILRIDVNNQDPGLNYAIPPDNPFIDSTGNFRKEIYALGLRNPWRCSFDKVSSQFWCGDVGSASREEVNIIISGENYGWYCYEGSLPFDTTNCLSPENYIFPVFEYPRSEGASVIGGYVYRGPNQPELSGKYIYADWFSRKVWSLEYDGINPPANKLLFTLPAAEYINSFGLDEANELYICAGSKIYKILPTAPIIAPTNLTAETTISTIAELNWVDNSDNEDGFTIERMENGGVFEIIASVPANITFYKDIIEEKTNYQYRVNAYNSNDESGYSNTACITVIFVSVENDFPSAPTDYILYQNYPNPFNPSTAFRFFIPEESMVKIEIINILGEEITIIINDIMQSGFYTEVWNAESSSRRISSGVYYVRMRAESLVSEKSFSKTINVVYLK
jgi:glucose/arabinose dehydrogenase